MPLDLSQCDGACTQCILGYKGKFSKEEIKGKFQIECTGIPRSYSNVSLPLLDQTGLSAEALLDPVMWAAEVLDWHCLDPNGAIWRRKTDDGTYVLDQAPTFDANNPNDVRKALGGKSPYHRPYQALILKCSSKRKILRLGRQLGKTEVLVVNALYNALTKSNFSVVVLAPYQTQIVLFWKKLENKIGRSPILSTSVKRSVKAPNFTIDFYNGSSISGFTAATKSGGNADAVRGQTAGLLIFDEGDYLADGDIVSAMSVVANQPEAAVWISSTPTGKRGYFYNTCHSPLWKEYHFPSWANPNWSEETEAFFKDSLVGMGWTHEIEAEFGEQEEGVFQNIFVEAAQADYAYSLMGREPHWTYCMGVDWNLDKIGTTICIVGWDPVAHKFSVVHRDVVRKEGSTQIAACDKIIELNRVWRPAWIYVDAGAGTMQIETLHKIGLDARKGRGLEHPDAILATSVVAYNFSSKIEITDPFTKEKTQKPAKPFLVENTVRKFERGEVRYSAIDKQLTAELLSYVVDRRTPAGIPVYKASIEDVGDHNLDAFMLALVAFTLKLSNLNRVTYDSHVAFTFSPLRRIVEQAGKREGTEEQVSPGKQVPLLKELVAKQKPHSDRAAVLERSPLTLGRNLPAANTSTPRRIWSWPGFMRDEPPPTRSRRSGGRPSRAGF